MDVKILGFRYNNIRQFRDLSISLAKGKSASAAHHVSLIQMPNGLGKTTTMELIRLCLNGKAADLNPDEVRAFRFLAKNDSKGEFELKLSVDGKLNYVTLCLNYDQGSAEYFTSNVEKGGRNRGLKLPDELRWRLTESFVRLFIFDGELAEGIRDLSKDEAERAITSLYFLDKLQELGVITIDKLVEEKQQKALTNARTSQARTQFETKLRNAREIERNLQSEADTLEKEIQRLRNEIAGRDAEIGKIISNNQTILTQFEEAKAEIAEYSRDLTSKTASLLDDVRSPRNLNDGVRSQLGKLAQYMVRLKLPRSQSVEFFKELAESKNCICGRPIGPSHKAHILARASEFLSEDDIGVINALKTSLRGLPPSKNLLKVSESIIKVDRDLQLAKQRRDRVELQLKGADRESVERLQTEKKSLEAELDSRRQEHAFLTEEDEAAQQNDGLAWDTNLPLCRKYVKEREREFADVTKTVEFVQQSNLLKQMLEEIRTESLNQLKDRVRKSTNQRIAKLLQRKDISIESIGSGLKVADHTGVSMGQSLAIAYAFLSSLFHDSPYDLPFVVDSPVGSMDLAVRREVGSLVPDLFSQLIVFIISSERRGFVDQVRTKEDVQYLTVCESATGSGNVEVSSEMDYFDRFQSKEEKT